MRTTNLKSIVQGLVIFSVLVGLLLCLNGCKKKPQPDPSDSTPASTLHENTSPSQATQPIQGTQPTTPTPPTQPSVPDESTSPIENTLPNTCVHIPGAWVVERISTCTTEGSRYIECTLCKGKVEEEPIPKIAHISSTWITDKPATCTVQGSQHQECTQCKEVLLTISVFKADHKTNTINGYNASATNNGLTHGYWCKTCGTTVQKQFIIPKIGEEGLSYNVNSDKTSCTVTGITSDATEVVIPTTLGGYAVTAIGEKAFENKANITAIYIPRSVTSIGANAFGGCTGLSNITYDGTLVQWIVFPKGANWNANTGNYTIYCTNTSLPK